MQALFNLLGLTTPLCSYTGTLPLLSQAMAASPWPYSVTVPDSSSTFQYTPFGDTDVASGWNLTYSGSADSSWNTTALPSGMSSHRTTRAGASVTMTWVGTAISLFGSGAEGSYEIALDGKDPVTGKPDSGSSTLAAFSGLEYTNHSVNMTTLDNSELSFLGATFTIGLGQSG